MVKVEKHGKTGRIEEKQRKTWEIRENKEKHGETEDNVDKHWQTGIRRKTPENRENQRKT